MARVNPMDAWRFQTDTLPEIVLGRADAEKINMGLTTMKGDRPAPEDVTTGKNYLTADELQGLENICEQFLLFTESKAFRGQALFQKGRLFQKSSFCFKSR